MQNIAALRHYISIDWRRWLSRAAGADLCRRLQRCCCVCTDSRCLSILFGVEAWRYIEFYNSTRPHRKLHNLSPNDFERSFNLWWGYKSRVQNPDNPVTIVQQQNNWFFAVFSKIVDHCILIRIFQTAFCWKNKKRNFSRTKSRV